VGVPASSSQPSPSGLRALPSVQGRACPVCASRKVVSDEVAHINAADDAKQGAKGGGKEGAKGGAKGRTMGVTLRLSECLHCDHRWTERIRGPWSELGQRMSGGARRRPDTNTAPRSAIGFVRPVAASR
jgi:hypothetical protein